MRLHTHKASDFSIREAIGNDAQALLTLFVSVVEEDSFFLLSTEECTRTVEQQKQYILHHLEHPSSCIFVALDGDMLVGKISILGGTYLRTQHVGMIEMFVHKDYRSKGIGSMLLRRVLNWAKANRYLKKLSLSVFADNHTAISLYKKFGFIEEGRIVGAFQEVDNRLRDNIYMGVFVS